MTSKIGSLLIAGVATMLVLEGPAKADIHDQTYTMLLRDGEDAGIVKRRDDGRDRPADQYYPGGEHLTMTQLSNGEILVFGMGTYRLNGELPQNRMQGFCASITMDPVAGPQMQKMEYISANNGDRRRNFNHSEVMNIFGGDVALLEYNYAPNNTNRAQRYAMVVGPNCAIMEGQTLVQAKNNDDCSETSGQNSAVVVEATPTVNRYYAFDGCNGNGGDDAHVRQTVVTKNGDNYTIETTQDFIIERREERTRGTILPTGDPAMVAACWTAGNTQPPNRGVRCAGIATTNEGNIEDRLMWRQYLMRKEGEQYRTQIRMANVLDAQGNPSNMVLAEYEELNKRRRREKGAATRMVTMVQFTQAGMDVLTLPETGFAVAQDVTHGTNCSTLWGTDGQESPALFLVSGSINGNPISQASAQTLSFNTTTREVISGRTFSLGTNQDVAWLSNIYGNNPQTQGRNFVQCVPNIQNPGYGVANGFMSEVKTFVGLPMTPRRLRTDGTNIAEDKLATELVLVPAVVAGTAPQDPDPITGIEAPAPGADPLEPVAPTDPVPNTPGSDASLGGCSVSGSSSSSGFLALIGLGLLFAIRRRKA